VIQNQFTDSECGMVYYGRGRTSSFSILRKAAECIKEADVVHLNSLFHGLSLFSFFYTKLRYPRKKILWSVRGELSPGALRFSSWKKTPVLFLYKKLVKNVVFHATSNQETKDTQAMFNDVQVVQIPNFIRVYKRLQVETKEQLLFMGRVHPIKAL